MIVNGVTLPDIPVELKNKYSHFFIVAHTRNGSVETDSYNLYCANDAVFYADSSLVGTDYSLLLNMTPGYTVLQYISVTDFEWSTTSMGSEENTLSCVIGTVPMGTWDDVTTLVWANHDIVTVTGMDDSGNPIFGGVYFPNSDIPAEPSPTRYSIAKAILDDIAHAIQEKKSTTALFVPESMAGEIRGIPSGGDFPNAEDAFFGTTANETEDSFTVNGTGNTYDSKYTCGYTFTPNVTFAVVGFKYWLRSNGGSANVKIWDAETQEVIVSKSVDTSTYNTWLTVMYDEPINLHEGKKYTVSLYANYNGALNDSNLTFNDKLGSVEGCYISGDNYPATKRSNIGPVILLMASVLTETVVTEYKIQTTTLTEIADEVKRITGAYGTLNPAQIITALQGISATTEE